VIESIPIYGRNFTNFELLLPGAVINDFQHPLNENSGADILINTNGQDYDANNFMINGMSNNDAVLGISIVNPPLDAVHEVKVTTSNYDAQFSQAGGSVIQVQTNSGSNQIHGSGFEFVQNWDTESGSLLPITLAAPATARSLLESRVRGLKNAKRLAALYSYRGAQLPWEASPIDAADVTPTFAGTGWEEQHVTPDVALGLWEYQMATGDEDFLREGTWPVLHAVAEWIESRGVSTSRGFEIRNVMGPDEGFQDVNNS